MQPNPDASRTVTWVMNDSAGLKTAQNISFVGGNATLAWTPVLLNWSQGSDFEANVSGSLDPNVTADASGLALGANLSNRLMDGDFGSSGVWAYANGTANNTTAEWIPYLGMARLNHSSPTTQTLWDSFANIAANWTPTSSLQSTSHVYQAAGAMGDFVNVTAGVDQFAGALNAGIINWSGYDQLRIMIHLNASAPAAFNMSALDSGFHTQTTQPVALAADWNTVTVDLDQLGPNRSALAFLRFRIVGLGGQALPPLNVLFLDAEIGRAKVADTTASVSQMFTKTFTAPSAGSAYLSFDWTIENQTGVASSIMSATLDGPSGQFSTSLLWRFPSEWHHLVADVSPQVAEAGPVQPELQPAGRARQHHPFECDGLRRQRGLRIPRPPQRHIPFPAPQLRRRFAIFASHLVGCAALVRDDGSPRVPDRQHHVRLGELARVRDPRDLRPCGGSGLVPRSCGSQHHERQCLTNPVRALRFSGAPDRTRGHRIGDVLRRSGLPPVAELQRLLGGRPVEFGQLLGRQRELLDRRHAGRRSGLRHGPPARMEGRPDHVRHPADSRVGGLRGHVRIPRRSGVDLDCRRVARSMSRRARALRSPLEFSMRGPTRSPPLPSFGRRQIRWVTSTTTVRTSPDRSVTST